MAINYVTLFEEALKQKFTEGLMTSDLENTQNVQFLGGKTVNIPKLTLEGLVNFDRSGSFASSLVSNEWEAHTMSHDRAKKFAIDPVDIEESGLTTAIAKVSKVFVEEHIIPELDAYRLKKVITGVDTGNRILSANLATDNVLTKWDDLVAKLDEAEVPQEGRIAYVTPAFKRALKTSSGIERRMDVVANDGNINRQIEILDGIRIITVPKSRMMDATTFTTGFTPAGKQVHCIILHPSAIIAPVKVNDASYDEASAVTNGVNLFFTRLYTDCFVIGSRKKGIAIYTEATV